MAVAKLVLEYDYDFDLFGVISAAKDYKLAWIINNELNIQLARERDLVFQLPRQGKMRIANFIFETDYSTLRLFKNKSVEFENVSKPYLVPELKEYDYLFQYEGESDTFSNDELLEHLQRQSQIQYVKTIDVENLPSRENLIC